MEQVVRVRRVAAWEGWCSPCAREDRPLQLTRSGPSGWRSWLSGIGDEDRVLLLTCRVCGQWQHVPLHEEDDPEVVLVEEAVPVLLRGLVAPVLPVAPLQPAAPSPAAEPTTTSDPAPAARAELHVAPYAARLPGPRRPVLVALPDALSLHTPLAPAPLSEPARVPAPRRTSHRRADGDPVATARALLSAALGQAPVVPAPRVEQPVVDPAAPTSIWLGGTARELLAG